MRIVVVGAGTAGWITALAVRSFLGDAVEITVVASPDEPIVGVGEGTTPQFVTHFLDAVGIPVSDLVKHAGATLKTSIRFDGWRGDGSHYHHPFADAVTPQILLGLHPPAPVPPHEQVSFQSRVAELAKVPFSRKPPYELDHAANPITNLVHHGAIAVHFDAFLLAGFLERVARDRGVEVVSDTVVGVEDKVNGDIEAVRLASGRVLRCGLLFDCTGFKRLIIGRHFRTPWVDRSDTLRTNRAMPFNMPLSEPVRPVTDAIAMDAGWLWRIPTQERYGCGYVFDRTFLDDDGARAEIRRRLGDVGDLSKAFDFQAGFYDTIWVRNCFAVGLSTSFFEPIEATSLWVTVLTLHEFLHHHLPQGDARSRRDFHAYWHRFMGRIVDYLYLHYLTPRTDQPFWATFRERTTPPPGVAALLADSGLRWLGDEPPELAGNPAPFSAVSWGWLADGLGLWDDAALDRLWRFAGLRAGYEQRLAEHERRVAAFTDACITHAQAIELLGGKLRV